MSPATRALTIYNEAWPLREVFAISRGSKTSSEVVVAEITEGDVRGRGECLPYARYGESIDSVLAQIELIRESICAGLDRAGLQSAMPPGAARNAVDCALWDLDSKLAGKRAWELAGLTTPEPAVTAFTLGLATPAEMAASASKNAARPLLKLKLGAEGALDRVAAIRAAAPYTRLIIDANEAWTLDDLQMLLPDLKKLGIEMVEQPLPAGADAALEHVDRILPIGADESCHHSEGFEALCKRYDVINIKLDKTGGLTEALRLHQLAQQAGMRIMVGCMVATSLSMAPATLLTRGADFVDLDGPLLLARDRADGLNYDLGAVHPPMAVLWG